MAMSTTTLAFSFLFFTLLLQAPSLVYPFPAVQDPDLVVQEVHTYVMNAIMLFSLISDTNGQYALLFCFIA